MMNSLAKRLTYRIMAMVLVMMAIITGMVYFFVRTYMYEEAQERYSGILQKHYEESRRRMSDVYVATKNNVHDIERDIDNPDMMYDHLRRIVSINPTIQSSTIMFEPDFYPGKGHDFMPMIRRDSTGVIYTANTDSIHGYQQARWYRECMEGDTGLWVGTYFDIRRFRDSKRRMMLTTYATPVHNRQGTPVGLLCTQLSIESMRKDLMGEIKEVNEKYEKGQSRQSYCFVIDHHGNYIIHPDRKRTLTTSFLDQTKETPDSIDDRVVARMVKGENGEAMMDDNGVYSWVYYRTLRYVNWTMVIVVPEDAIYHNGRMLNTIILLIVLFGLLAIYFICRHMIKKITMPLHYFALSAEEVAKGNFSSPLPDVQSSDEVRMLHDSFENMQMSLSIFVDELQKTTTSKAALERELKIASGIQMAMLPKTFPPFPERNDIDIYASMTPAREVGGDFYDYLLRDDRLFFCIGDVSGKGIPAALVMAVTRSLFHSIANEEMNPERIIQRINRAICDGNEASYFATMFVGILDLRTGRLDYCNAGHEAPLVAGRQLPIRPNLPVGALEEWVYEGQQMQLQSGDMLFLFTDGITEAKNHAGELLGRRHVLQLASEHINATAQQMVELMVEEVHRHAADAEQSDDITLLVIRWKEKDVKRKGLTLRASMDEIDRLKPYIEDVTQQVGIDVRESKRLRLAVEEAVANVINYGEATTITLQARVEDDQLELSIADDGKPFDPTAGSSTDLSLPPDQRPPGGMGIILLERMTEGLSYQRSDGKNVLTLMKMIKK